ncbi:MAG: hypothetical protein R2909_14325 [Gemmatimonadales bacterium]
MDLEPVPGGCREQQQGRLATGLSVGPVSVFVGEPGEVVGTGRQAA